MCLLFSPAFPTEPFCGGLQLDVHSDYGASLGRAVKIKSPVDSVVKHLRSARTSARDLRPQRHRHSLKADAIRELDKKTDRKLAAMEAKIDALLKASYASLAAQGFAEPA